MAHEFIHLTNKEINMQNKFFEIYLFIWEAERKRESQSSAHWTIHKFPKQLM